MFFSICTNGFNFFDGFCSSYSWVPNICPRACYFLNFFPTSHPSLNAYLDPPQPPPAPPPPPHPFIIISNIFYFTELDDLNTNISISGFYPSTFVYIRFSPKIQFLYCFLSSVAWPHGRHWKKIFEIQVCKSLENFLFFFYFCWNFRVLWRVLKKSLPERYIQFSLMRACL